MLQRPFANYRYPQVAVRLPDQWLVLKFRLCRLQRPPIGLVRRLLPSDDRDVRAPQRRLNDARAVSSHGVQVAQEAPQLRVAVDDEPPAGAPAVPALQRALPQLGTI